MKSLSSFPRRIYVTEPTPLQPAPRLSRLLGGPEIYIKRDDLLPGAGGGNKTRKLEFSIGEALAQGADTLITSGAIQSNHCRLTLSWARVEGLECHLVLQEPAPGAFDPQAGGNNFLYQLLGADSLRIVSGRGQAAPAMEQLARECRERGRNPYLIPVGGSNAVGATGYAACALELISQFRRQDLQVDHLVVPSGSAGTQAGLLAGLRGAGSSLPVTGINVSRGREPQERSVYELALQTASRLGVESPLPRDSVDCNGDYVGPGYALPTPEMMEGGRARGPVRRDPPGPGLHRQGHGRDHRPDPQGGVPKGTEGGLHPHRRLAGALRPHGRVPAAVSSPACDRFLRERKVGSRGGQTRISSTTRAGNWSVRRSSSP